MTNNSATREAFNAEQAAPDARFRSTKQNAADRATQAEEAAHQAAQAAHRHGYRPQDYRTTGRSAPQQYAGYCTPPKTPTPQPTTSGSTPESKRSQQTG